MVCAGNRSRIELVAFDLDGVLYRGRMVLPHAREAVQAVRNRNLYVRFVTNNSTLHRRMVTDRLRAMGFTAYEEEVLGSAAAAAAWLRARVEAGSLVVVVGESGLLEELSEAGFDVLHADQMTDDVCSAEAVVVGLDRKLTYSSLARAQWHIRRGALFVATNTDATFPAEDRLLPGAGSIVAAVATAAGSEPHVIGKPALAMAEVLTQSTRIAPERIVFVGDRVDTDIVFGKRAGMKTVLVLTGVHGRKDAEQLGVEPDAVIKNLAMLPRLLDDWGGLPSL